MRPRPDVPKYEFNPVCACAWCDNKGKPVARASDAWLGYDLPHIPPNTRAPWAQEKPA